MNILRNVRWGYTGDGMACGPMGGFDAVELVIEQEDKKLIFVRLDCMGEFAGASLRDHSTFDRFVFITDVENMDAHDYDFDLNEYEDEMSSDDPYFNVLNLGFAMLWHSYENNGRDGDGRAAEYDRAREFAGEWLNKDLDKCDIPVFRIPGEDDDWDEEEADEG